MLIILFLLLCWILLTIDIKFLRILNELSETSKRRDACTQETFFQVFEETFLQRNTLKKIGAENKIVFLTDMADIRKYQI